MTTVTPEVELEILRRRVEELKEQVEPKKKVRVKKGRPAKYPWPELMDGEEHTFKHGEDFDCLPQSFGMGVRYTARRNHMDCEVSVDQDEGLVHFRFLRRASLRIPIRTRRYERHSPI